MKEAYSKPVVDVKEFQQINVVSSVKAVSKPPSTGQDTCLKKCRVYTRRQSMSRKPSSRYSQKCASLRTMCMVMNLPVSIFSTK